MPLRPVSLRRLVLALLAGGMLASVVVGCSGQPADISTTDSVRHVVPPSPIAYVQGTSVWVSDEHGEQAFRVGEPGAQYDYPIWFTPQESLLLVSKIGEYYRFIEHTLATGEERTIHSTVLQPEVVGVSPNRQWIMYISDEELYVVNVSSAETTRLAEGVQAADWSFDSKHVVYSTTEPDNYQLILHEVGGTAESKEADFLLWSSPEPVVSPVFSDARTVLFEGSTETGRTVLEIDLTSYQVVPVVDSGFRGGGDAEVVASRLQMHPSRNQLLYWRHDETSSTATARVINLATGQQDTVAEEVVEPTWGVDRSSLYMTQYSDGSTEGSPTVLQADTAGTITPLLQSARSVVTEHNNFANVSP